MNDINERIDTIQPEGDLVLHVDRLVTADVAKQIRERLDEILPGRRVLILGQGMRLQKIADADCMERIEHKLDELLEQTKPVEVSVEGSAFRDSRYREGNG